MHEKHSLQTAQNLKPYGMKRYRYINNLCASHGPRDFIKEENRLKEMPSK